MGYTCTVILNEWLNFGGGPICYHLTCLTQECHNFPSLCLALSQFKNRSRGSYEHTSRFDLRQNKEGPTLTPEGGAGPRRGCSLSQLTQNFLFCFYLLGKHSLTMHHHYLH